MRRYYQQLEGGILDPSRVAASVWDAITAVLDRPRAALLAPRDRDGCSRLSPMYRADKLFEPGDMPRPAAPAAEPSRRTRSTPSSSAR